MMYGGNFVWTFVQPQQAVFLCIIVKLLFGVYFCSDKKIQKIDFTYFFQPFFVNLTIIVNFHHIRLSLEYLVTIMSQ